MTVEPTPARRRRARPASGPPVRPCSCWRPCGSSRPSTWCCAGGSTTAGIRPRESEGLLGILFAPLLHGGFSHLLSNTIPLLVLGTLVAASGRGVFWKVTAAVVLLGGLGTWLIAPANTVTIGASGLVFGYLGYLLVAGVRTRHWRDLLIGVAVLVVYGTLLARRPALGRGRQRLLAGAPDRGAGRGPGRVVVRARAGHRPPLGPAEGPSGQQARRAQSIDSRNGCAG